MFDNVTENAKPLKDLLASKEFERIKERRYQRPETVSDDLVQKVVDKLEANAGLRNKADKADSKAKQALALIGLILVMFLTFLLVAAVGKLLVFIAPVIAIIVAFLVIYYQFKKEPEND